MIKYLFVSIFLINLVSCGYPDVDSVPDFKNVNLTEEELTDFCTNTHTIKKNIDKCINDNKSND